MLLYYSDLPFHYFPPTHQSHPLLLSSSSFSSFPLSSSFLFLLLPHLITTFHMTLCSWFSQPSLSGYKHIRLNFTNITSYFQHCHFNPRNTLRCYCHNNIARFITFSNYTKIFLENPDILNLFAWLTMFKWGTGLWGQLRIILSSLLFFLFPLKSFLWCSGQLTHNSLIFSTIWTSLLLLLLLRQGFSV